MSDSPFISNDDFSPEERKAIRKKMVFLEKELIDPSAIKNMQSRQWVVEKIAEQIANEADLEIVMKFLKIFIDVKMRSFLVGFVRVLIAGKTVAAALGVIAIIGGASPWLIKYFGGE